MPRQRLYWDLVESVWSELVDWDDVSTFMAAFRAAPEPPRTLFAAYWVKYEVDNGGFWQLFWNSTGILAPEGAAALQALGMPGSARVVQEAMSWFPQPYPRERHQRIYLLEKFAENHSAERHPFRSLDSQFYELVEAEMEGFDACANAYASARR